MKKNISSIILDNIKTIFYALILAVLIRSFLFQPFYIPSSSMEPNLLIGVRLFVSKYSYGYSKHSLPFSPPIYNKRLFEKNSDFNFWKSLDLGFNLNSLCWFETARGKEFLEQKNYLFKSTHVNFTKEKVKYEDKKLGEDRVSPKKKVKNILDLFEDEEKKRR